MIPGAESTITAVEEQSDQARDAITRGNWQLDNFATLLGAARRPVDDVATQLHNSWADSLYELEHQEPCRFLFNCTRSPAEIQIVERQPSQSHRVNSGFDASIRDLILRLLKTWQNENYTCTAIPGEEEVRSNWRGWQIVSHLQERPKSASSEYYEQSQRGEREETPRARQAKERPNQFHIELLRAFSDAIDEVFEDGMESKFSRRLDLIIRTHGVSAIDALHQFLLGSNIDVEAAGETLRQIGLIEHPATKSHRLALLTLVLQSSDIEAIRDAASLGLSFMDDSAAIFPLRAAHKSETSPILKRNLEAVLRQFERKAQ